MNNTQTKAIGVGHWVAALTAAMVAGWFNFNFILTHFAREPYLLDTGWFAGIVYHPTLNLAGPVATGGVSFYNTHVSPILYLLGLPSFLLKDTLPVYYAKVLAVVYATLAVAGVVAAEPLTRKWQWFGPVAAGVVGLGLAFSGISMAAILYPHFEPLYAGLAVLFLALVFRGWQMWAMVPFTLALLVREDAGLHLFGILALLFCCSWRVESLRPWRTALGSYALAALAYSLVAIAVQKTYDTGDDALRRIYLGSPPYAHVTMALLSQRLGIYFAAKKFIWVPCLVVLGLAYCRRSWILLCGVGAVVPWLVWNFLAKADGAGELAVYYPFPLLVTLIWPILTYPLESQRSAPGRALASGILVLGLSLFLFAIEHPNDWARAMQAGITPTTFATVDYEQGRKLLTTLELAKQDVQFESTVAGLFPNDVAQKQIYDPKGNHPTPEIFVGMLGASVQPVSYLSEGTDWNYYLLPKLHLYVLSRQPLPAEVLAATVLASKGHLRAPVVFPGLRLGTYAYVAEDGSIQDIVPHGKNLVVSEPYVQLPAGKYAVRLLLATSRADPANEVSVEVVVDAGRNVLASKTLTGASANLPQGIQTLSLNFSAINPDDSYEFRVWKDGAVEVGLVDLIVEKVE